MNRVDLERWKPREVARLLALLETERRYYQDIVSNLPVGLVIVSPELWLLSANRFFRQSFGLKSEEISRRRIDEVLRVDDLNERIAEVFSTGVPQRNILYSPPVEGASQFFRVSIMALRNWEDEMETEVLLVFEDLTGLEQPGSTGATTAQRALNVEEPGPTLIPQALEPLTKPEALLENFDAMVWECDPSLKLTDVSPYAEEMLGYPVQELLSDQSIWAQRVVPEDVKFVEDLYRDAIENRNRMQFEYRCRTATGRTLWVRESLRIQRDRSGNAIKINGVSIDISENRRLTEGIVLSHKMESLSRLTSRVAHDYNNFLMIIGNYGEDLLHLLPPENPLRADVEQIVQAAGKVQDLTNKLLSFSRRPVPKSEVTGFGAIVSGALQQLSAERLGPVEMFRILDPDPGLIDADPDQVRKAIVALLDAALAGANQGGTLTVETLREDGVALSEETAVTSKAVLSINASAWELDVEARRRLFEPTFLRTDASPAVSDAYWFVKQNRGEISVRGESGRGTTIVVSFPAVAAHHPLPGRRQAISLVEPPPVPVMEQKPEPAPPPQPVPAPLPVPVPEAPPATIVEPEPTAEAETIESPVPEPVVVISQPQPQPAVAEAILVVDDEEGIRTLMRKILTRNGYEVLEAEGGPQAIDLARKHSGQIHLLVTDLVMPEMSGQELAQELRKFLPDLRVVFASGYTDDAVIHSGALPAGTTYLQKPFTLGSLLERVKEVLGAADKGK